MLLLAVCLIALCSPLLAGRWSARLLLHRWRWPGLIWATLALQVLVVEVSLPGVLAPVLHVGTYLVALVFLWLNRDIPGVAFVGAGAASNGVTIALNGGVLPASATASAAAGIDRDNAFANSAVVSDPVLPWLGDVFAWPEPLPLANTFSVGDVLIVLGVVLAAWSGTERLGRRRRQPDASPEPADDSPESPAGRTPAQSATAHRGPAGREDAGATMGDESV